MTTSDNGHAVEPPPGSDPGLYVRNVQQAARVLIDDMELRRFCVETATRDTRPSIDTLDLAKAFYAWIVNRIEGLTATRE